MVAWSTFGRRAFIKLGMAFFADCAAPRVLAASQTASSPAKTATAKVVPVSEQLLHTVIRIECPVPGGVSAGTGFFFMFFTQNDQKVPVIVTNKHVVKGHDTCHLVFNGKRSDGSPDLDNLVHVTVTDLQTAAIAHPDPTVDLVIIPIAALLAKLSGQKQDPYFVQCDDNTIPTPDLLSSLTPIEDILTVGFPGFAWDTTHNLPIFHRGITATPVYVNFQGREEFLIDAAVWPGASGSPVFLFEQGAIYNARTNSTMLAVRVTLLGIIYATVIQNLTGDIFVQEAPTKPHALMSVPSNLGLCIASRRLFDFQPLLIARGIHLKAGYKLRTNDG